jgi:hypothetical protein
MPSSQPDERDGWTIDGQNILSPERLAIIRDLLEGAGPVIVEHWFYYGSCSPNRLVFDDYDRFIEYLKANAKPGDAFHIWDFPKVCKDDNTLTDGKFPDEHGRVPRGGAY